MTVRFYILPIKRVGTTRGPKYFSWRYDPDPPGITCPWSMKDYGAIDECVIAADIQPGHFGHDGSLLRREVAADAPFDVEHRFDQIGSRQRGQRTVLRAALGRVVELARHLEERARRLGARCAEQAHLLLDERRDARALRNAPRFRDPRLRTAGENLDPGRREHGEKISLLRLQPSVAAIWGRAPLLACRKVPRTWLWDATFGGIE